ncbi:Leucine-rich repeat-containing protein 9, partial [Bienertia sinuspersici]
DRMKDSHHEPCVVRIFLDNLKDCYVLSLLCALNKKLRAIHLSDKSLEKGFMRDLSKRGLTCKELYLRSSQLRQLNLSGSFMRLQTLNLDFNTSLTTSQASCFSCMPNLEHLSVCATRISNLWTTATALSKLPSLVELRFQNCLCCNNTGPCPKSSAQRTQDDNWIGSYDHSFVRASSRPGLLLSHHGSYSEDILQDTSVTEDSYWPREDFSEDYDVDAPSHHQELSFPELLYLMQQAPTEDGDLLAGGLYSSQASSSDDSEKRKYLAHHPSPICFEKSYRDYIISSLPRLQVLDNLPVNVTDKESAKFRFLKCFEYLPYRRREKESVVGILNKRAINSSQTSLRKHSHMKSAMYHCRSLGAAKVGASVWPSLHPLSTSGYVFGDEKKSLFEYHPSDSGLMTFGTLDGEVVVVNHENAKIFSYIPSLGAMNSVLGLCWLKKYPSKLIAGSNSGALRLYDVRHWQKPLWEGILVLVALSLRTLIDLLLFMLMQLMNYLLPVDIQKRLPCTTSTPENA